MCVLPGGRQTDGRWWPAVCLLVSSVQAVRVGAAFSFVQRSSLEKRRYIKDRTKRVPEDDYYIIMDYYTVGDEYCMTYYTAVTVLGTFIFKNSFSLSVTYPRVSAIVSPFYR